MILNVCNISHICVSFFWIPLETLCQVALSTFVTIINSNYQRDSRCAQLAAVYSQQGRTFSQTTLDNCFNITCTGALETITGVVTRFFFVACLIFYFTLRLKSSQHLSSDEFQRSVETQRGERGKIGSAPQRWSQFQSEQKVMRVWERDWYGKARQNSLHCFKKKKKIQFIKSEEVNYS